MKKIVCLLVVALLIATVAFAAEKAKISTANLANLKGTWEGMMNFGEVQGGAASAPARLEILNDAVPVKAKLTIENVPDAVARALGISGGTNVFESSDGWVTSRGSLMFAGENKNFMNFTLSGEKKMRGAYFFRGIEGDVSLSKKK